MLLLEKYEYKIFLFHGNPASHGRGIAAGHPYRTMSPYGLLLLYKGFINRC